MKFKIDRATWTTRHGFPDQQTHKGWEVTVPTAMGTSTVLTESFREAVSIVNQAKTTLGEIDAERAAIAKYCTQNPWTTSGT